MQIQENKDFVHRGINTTKKIVLTGKLLFVLIRSLGLSKGECQQKNYRIKGYIQRNMRAKHQMLFQSILIASAQIEIKYQYSFNYVLKEVGKRSISSCSLGSCFVWPLMRDASIFNSFLAPSESIFYKTNWQKRERNKPI